MKQTSKDKYHILRKYNNNMYSPINTAFHYVMKPIVNRTCVISFVGWFLIVSIEVLQQIYVPSNVMMPLIDPYNEQCM